MPDDKRPKPLVDYLHKVPAGFCRSRALPAIVLVAVLLGCAVFAKAQSTDDRPEIDWARLQMFFPGANRTVYSVSPTDTDKQIQRFVAKHIIVFDRTDIPQTLLVFLSGTSGQPLGGRFFMQAAADSGYRAIGLEYNDVPAAVQVCQQDRDRSCYERFREKRIYGTDAISEIPDTPVESIVNRLTKLLLYLDAQHPAEHWKDYLIDGQLNWARIAVSGLSQGAGMAAFIGKRESVARVILFSSPWDYYGPTRQLAPWIGWKSATPPDRWYGAYHQREKEAGMLHESYKELRIPKDHVLVETAEPVQQPKSPNPYHVTMLGTFMPRDENRHPVYWKDWLLMLGTGH
jgi:hypothetical protein